MTAAGACGPTQAEMTKVLYMGTDRTQCPDEVSCGKTMWVYARQRGLRLGFGYASLCSGGTQAGSKA